MAKAEKEQAIFTASCERILYTIWTDKFTLMQ